MNNPLKDAMDFKLAGLTWDKRRSDMVLCAIQKGTKMKKKMTVSLAMALSLVLIGAVAFAALTFTRAPQADAIYRARQKLTEAYGLSPATLGLFFPVEEQKDDARTVTFYGEGMPNALIGNYTVVIKGEEISAAWSHDGADKALLDSGDFSSPAWGQKQMKKALLNPDTANQAMMQFFEKHPEEKGKRPAYHPPEMKLKDGESYWQGMIIRDAKPDSKALPVEAAMEKAKAAMIEEFGFTQEDLKDAHIEHSYHEVVSKKHNPLHGFRFYFEKDKVNMDIGVMMDAYTGDIYLIGIVTGANE